MTKQKVFLSLLLIALAGAGRPTQAPAQTGQDIARRSIERRAVEAVIWGMPAVNTDLMLQAMINSAKGKPNQIVYWSRLPDWKNQTLTPNPDVIYLMPFFTTKDVGPMVLEIPPADDGVINGTIMDAWQVPLEDVGPAGVDKGKGGKYLILPPKHSAAVPDGYIALPSMNYQGYALLRSILRSGSEADVAKAVAYARRIKLYPLSQAANPPATTFVDAIDVVYDSTIPYGLIRNMTRSGRGSQSQGLQRNSDGSVDIYFGPKTPDGKETNWVPTNPGGQFEVRFRFYGPEKPLFDKTWKLPDIERVAAQ